MDKPMSTHQVARRLGVSRRRVLDLIERGVLPASKPPGGGFYRITQADIQTMRDSLHRASQAIQDRKARRLADLAQHPHRRIALQSLLLEWAESGRISFEETYQPPVQKQRDS